MEQSYPPQLTLREKLDLIPAWSYIFGYTIYYAITGLFRRAKSYRLYVGLPFLRVVAGRLSTRQIQSLWPSTNKVYENFVRQKGVAPDTVALKHGGLGLWLGNKKSKKVLIFFHGGGFQYPAVKPHFEFISGLVDSLNAVGHDLSVFFLTYTLTPYARYPTQLRQAVEALRYILVDTKRSPSDVIMAGDSAGGNLTLAVLSHLSHPHPEIEPIDINEHLAGIAVIGPWVTFDPTLPSAQQNHKKDLVDIKSTERSGQAYLGGKEADNWNQQILTNADWWKGTKIRDAFIATGSNEVLFSAIEGFARIFKDAIPNATFVIGTEECHVAPVYNRMVGVNTETEQGKDLKCWLAACL